MLPYSALARSSSDSAIYITNFCMTNSLAQKRLSSFLPIRMSGEREKICVELAGLF